MAGSGGRVLLDENGTRLHSRLFSSVLPNSVTLLSTQNRQKVMESQGSTVAAPLPDKQGQAYSQQPAPGYAPGYNAGQVSQAPVPQVMYPPGQAPPAYSTAPPVQYIIQNPQPLVNPPNDYFIQAILVTVFCFWPTGIIAIIKALDSRRAAQIGDAQNAQLSSQAARKMSLISLFVGIAILVVIAIIIVIELVVVFSLY